MNDNRTIHLVDIPIGGKVALETLNAFDTILVRTHNSNYRILLLDPRTGRALVEGGSTLDEPSEALVKGSAVTGSLFKGGSICVGGRLEMWVDERVVITSPIESVEVHHNNRSCRQRHALATYQARAGAFAKLFPQHLTATAEACADSRPKVDGPA